MNYIADVIQQIPPSGIRKFFDIASELDDVISLGVGEPDFDTPWYIREQGIYALEQGRTTYTSNAGLIELRKEIAKYLRNRFQIQYDPVSQILVTVGASEAIDIGMRAVLNPGDEVLVVEPSFVSYKPCIMMAGGIPKTIPLKAENNFRLTAEELEGHITEKTKALVLTFPNNPTGAIMEKEDLEAVAKVLAQHDILVFSDEIYAELTYGDRNHVSIASIKEMYPKTIVINGFSKAFAMTGWRLGYVAGPEEIIKAMTKIHQYIIMCAPTVAQIAGVKALKGLKHGQEEIQEMKEDYDQRRRVMVNGFRDMGLDCFEPLGAFYVFPSIQSTGLSSEAFCEKLLFEKKVAVVPGNAFGECGEGFIRCSYAYAIESLKQALDIIGEFVAGLR